MMKAILFFFLCLSCCALFAEEAKPYRAYIKENSLLTTIDGKNSLRNVKGIYANVSEFNSKAEFFVIYDKNGKPIYTVPGESIVEIDKDIQLLPRVSAETIYPPASVFKVTDKEAFFDTQFNLHVDALQFNDIYSGSAARSTLATRLEARTLYVSSLPINFGFGINYQMATWNANLLYDDGSGNEPTPFPVNMKLSILSLGPQFQRYVHDNDGFSVSLLLGAEYAPIYEISSSFGKDTYSGMLFDFGIEALWQTNIGKLGVGSHFRRHDIKLDSSSRVGVESTPKDIALNSLGIMVGYKYEWDL